MELDWGTIRTYAHIAAGSLTFALRTALYLARGRYVRVSRALLASMAFWMASLWFWGLGATVKDHALFNRGDLMPILAALEAAFVFLGWAWFCLAFVRTFRIEPRRKQMEVTS